MSILTTVGVPLIPVPDTVVPASIPHVEFKLIVFVAVSYTHLTLPTNREV